MSNIIRIARPMHGESLDSATAPELRGECQRVALILQGGGALGSYQGGVCEALAEAGYQPDWVAGISIGAINAALIVGNPPEKRLAALREFWNRVTKDRIWAPEALVADNEPVRRWLHAMAAAGAAMLGVPAFFSPRPVPALFSPPGSPGAVSYYDTGPLRATLEELVDFDLINRGPVRLSIGAVNVLSGNFVYFDSKERRLGPEHIMASGALPPGFPPVEIDGEPYWDGGLVSNTPLAAVLEDSDSIDTLCFQVDLFPARGLAPQNMADVEQRRKDIQYSSRTRLNTDAYRVQYDLNARLRQVLNKLSPAQRREPAMLEIAAGLSGARMHIAQLIYRPTKYELDSKDYEFSRMTMLEHWRHGRDDTAAGLAGACGWRQPMPPGQGLATYDLTAHARNAAEPGKRQPQKTPAKVSR